MSLATRKRLVLAKIEATYGVDSTPLGGTDSMLVKNLTLNPIQADLVSRDLIRPYLGNSEQLLASTFVEIDFETEYVGSGVVGLAPAYDALLRSCGFVSVPTTAAITITSAAGIATVTKTAHGLAVGDSAVISGAVETAYNKTAIVLTVPTSSTFTYAVTGTPASPATGTPLMTVSIAYNPISGPFESSTMYYNVDGVLHKLTGCLGTVEINLTVKQIPTFKFKFTGLFNSPTDVVAPIVDFAKFMIPEIVNTQNTPGFTLFGYSGNMESMNLNISNEVQYITLVGSESVKILDRKPAGSIVFEAPTIASKDFFSLVKSSTSGAMVISHGLKNGYKIQLNAPKVLLGNPSYQDSNGVQMLSAPFTINPTTGNDELSLIFS